MATLLVGFDSAWTPTKSGALVGALQLDGGTYSELGPPRIVDFPEAESVIVEWQREKVPAATIVLLDQPTIVQNAAGQRPVENVVGSRTPSGTSRAASGSASAAMRSQPSVTTMPSVRRRWEANGSR